MRVGRPLKFSTPEELEALAMPYFKSRLDDMGCPIRDDAGNVKYPITYSGLCYHLNTTRDVIDDYEQKPEFSNIVKKLRGLIEMYYENRLSYANATGSIFALKNMGWKDSQDLNMGGQKDNPIKSELAAEDKELLAEWLKHKGVKL